MIINRARNKTSFFNPAITAAIPDIVPENKVAGANSLIQSSFQISTFVGQGMGGYLFMLFGAPILILIDGATYLFSALSETFITIPQTLPEKSSGLKEKLTQFKKDTIDGFKFVWRNKGMSLDPKKSCLRAIIVVIFKTN